LSHRSRLLSSANGGCRSVPFRPQPIAAPVVAAIKENGERSRPSKRPSKALRHHALGSITRSNDSGDIETRTNFAALLGKLGKYDDALNILDSVLATDPASAKACAVASAILSSASRFPEGLIYIDRAIALEPQSPNLRIRRADILRQLGRGTEAICECDQILSLDPDDAEALHERALVLRSLDQPAQALKDLEELQLITKTPALVASDRGWLLAELGRGDEALKAFEEAVEIQPGLGAAWYGRSILRFQKEADQGIPRMEKAIATKQLAHRDRINLSFALGKSYLDIGNGDKAFEYLSIGNTLKRSTFRYDWQSDHVDLEKMSAAFRSGALSCLPHSTIYSEMPVFVFGMPRSGTTLVEQILAAHPLVGTLGESAMIGDLARSMMSAGTIISQGLEMEAPILDKLGNLYLEHARAISPGKLHVVDKMPANFLHLGLISTVLPGARMIHCRRNALDTCLSCYSTLFTHGHEYSYDLEDLGRYYMFYANLMAHWRNVLPPERILEIDYEDLISDSEIKMRRILDFCGLPWDPACLRFYETKRHIKTASLNQVRSPIYKTSVGRAEQFRPWLGPLEAVLDGVRP